MYMCNIVVYFNIIIFIIVAGYEVDAINSVQFSNHTGQSMYTLLLHTMSNFQLAYNCLVYVYIIYCMWENFDVEKTENFGEQNTIY